MLWRQIIQLMIIFYKTILTNRKIINLLVMQKKEYLPKNRKQYVYLTSL